MQKPIGVGIVGCGNVFSAYYELAARLEAGGLIRLVSICGRETQRDRVLHLTGTPHFTTRFEDLLSAPVDLVVILTSMQTHAQLARKALAAGKHVLVEKPMATTLEEAQELMALSRREKRFLFPAPFTVLSPTFQAIARRIREGAIGNVVAARGLYGWAGPSWADWFYQSDAGALFDLGVYNLTTLTGWLGPAQRVMAMCGTAQPVRTIDGREVGVRSEDIAQVLIGFGESCFASVTTGFAIQQYQSPTLELYGTEGTIRLRGDDWDPDGYEIWENRLGCWQYYKETDSNWPWTDGLRHAVECISGGTASSLVTPEHAYHVLELMLKARLSARDGASRPVTSTFPLPPIVEGPASAAHLVHDRTRVVSPE